MINGQPCTVHIVVASISVGSSDILLGIPALVEKGCVACFSSLLAYWIDDDGDQLTFGTGRLCSESNRELTERMKHDDHTAVASMQLQAMRACVMPGGGHCELCSNRTLLQAVEVACTTSDAKPEYLATRARTPSPLLTKAATEDCPTTIYPRRPRAPTGGCKTT